VDLRISQVTASETVQAWQNTDTQLIVTFAAELPQDRETTLTVAYRAEPTQGLYFRTPEMGYPAGDTTSSLKARRSRIAIGSRASMRPTRSSPRK